VLFEGCGQHAGCEVMDRKGELGAGVQPPRHRSG
jgi:hypothetical protein